MNWYDTNIEKPIRKIVKKLRDNGINTISSCGHEMYVECNTFDPSHEIDTIYNVLVPMGIKEYEINVNVHFMKGWWYHKHLKITFPKKSKV
jgi:hypothetical protein